MTLKINLAYSSSANSLPKTTVDELEFLSAASLGNHFAYRLEQYAIDGAVPGLTRDAWLRYDGTPFSSTGSFHLLAGQFTLPLPVDPETMRETAAHYAVFDQAVGANPFTLFDPKLGIDFAFASKTPDISSHIAFMNGHDRQSGLPAFGLDRMLASEYTMRGVRLSAYYYAGERPLRPVSDTFQRQALAAELRSGRFRLVALAQDGHDSSADGSGASAASSGSFVQARWQFSAPLVALTRYDITTGGSAAQSTPAHSLLLTLVQGLDRNGKITLEFVSSQPGAKRSLNSALLFAY